jgi:sugar phosphate isomerase/epimerase
MRFGVCTSLANAQAVLDAGFDYVELGAVEMAKREPWDASAYAGLPVEVTNLFFPGDIDLYGTKEWQSYSEGLFARAAEVGIEIMVIGSGGARKSRPQTSIVDGMKSLVNGTKIPLNPAKAEQAFLKIVRQMQGATIIKLAPESLNRTETDCFNDCERLANQTERAGIGYTADAYHILFEWDQNGREGGRDVPGEFFWQDQLPYAPTHCHLATLAGRSAPEPGDPLLLGFFARLRALNYQGRVSLECNGLTPENYAHAQETLRSFVSS